MRHRIFAHMHQRIYADMRHSIYANVRHIIFTCILPTCYAHKVSKHYKVVVHGICFQVINILDYSLVSSVSVAIAMDVTKPV